MAGTTLDTVCDYFMILQSDYRLDAIFNTSGSAGLNNYLEGWLILSISDFSGVCNQDLSYDTTSQAFSVVLAQNNINILAFIMIKYWLQKTVQDVLMMNLSITDHDFKHYSEAQNLKEKRDLYNMKREEINKLLSDYSYSNNNWANWRNQVYYT